MRLWRFLEIQTSSFFTLSSSHSRPFSMCILLSRLILFGPPCVLLALCTENIPIYSHLSGRKLAFTAGKDYIQSMVPVCSHSSTKLHTKIITTTAAAAGKKIVITTHPKTIFILHHDTTIHSWTVSTNPVNHSLLHCRFLPFSPKWTNSYTTNLVCAQFSEWPKRSNQRMNGTQMKMKIEGSAVL